MLERLRLVDFKSFADATVPLAPLTFLVGENASGKSNFLEAIRFLQMLDSDLGISETLEGERRGTPAGRWPGIRGGSREAALAGRSRFSIESSWLAPAPDDQGDYNWSSPRSQQRSVQHHIACRTHPAQELDEEWLGADGAWMLKTQEGPADQLSLPLPPVQWRGLPSASVSVVSRELSILWTILGSVVPGSPAVPGEIVEVASMLSEAWKRIAVPELNPGRMRGFGRPSSAGDAWRDLLGGDGSNLSGALATICDNASSKQTFLDWMQEFCAPEIEDIDFIRVPELDDVLAVFIERGGRRVTARSLSDGTLRFLGLLLALRLAEPGSVVLLEEPDTGLHPTRIKLLVEFLESVTAHRHIQVMATTHSPTLLQWLSDRSLHDTVVFGRLPDREGTVVRRAGDLPHLEQVLGQNRADIADLFATGWLEAEL